MLTSNMTETSCFKCISITWDQFIGHLIIVIYTPVHYFTIGASHDSPNKIDNDVHILLNNNLGADRLLQLIFSEYDPQKYGYFLDKLQNFEHVLD